MPTLAAFAPANAATTASFLPELTFRLSSVPAGQASPALCADELQALAVVGKGQLSVCHDAVCLRVHGDADPHRRGSHAGM